MQRLHAGYYSTRCLHQRSGGGRARDVEMKPAPIRWAFSQIGISEWMPRHARTIVGASCLVVVSPTLSASAGAGQDGVSLRHPFMSIPNNSTRKTRYAATFLRRSLSFAATSVLAASTSAVLPIAVALAST